ncbi:MAG: cyclic nucleotide-binding protein [Polaromonas sp.]|jgi:CRP/FNR family cyclic AMP-dependent transcriptional regulator|nr:cyclic nucleotide-binding protein [Polaromonas sp.]MDB5845444.1 cyclic nucleotide-binding protein [Polaromonas sp.]
MHELEGQRYLCTIMNSLPSGAVRFDVQTLAQVIQNCEDSDALRCQLSLPHWTTLASFMQPFPLNRGQVLIEQGARDATLYFIESGALSSHCEDEHAKVHTSLVGAGTVLGEGSFFSRQPRRATVYASGPCRMWCLTPLRFKDLARHHSAIALELTLAMASVMAKRLCIPPKRAAVT